MSNEPISETLVEQLRHIPMFAALGDEDRRAVAENAHMVEVPSGEAITREGTLSEDFFVLLSGEAVVSVIADSAGESVEVGTVRPGDSFGELGALLNEPRTATVIADSRCRLLSFDKDALNKLFTHPRFGMAFSKEMVHRLKDALVVRNQLHAGNLPEKIVLEVPDLTRLRQYMVTYYATAIKNVLKYHRLISDRRFPVYETWFTLTSDDQKRWMELFDTSDTWTPFTYHTTVGTMALMRVVADVGVNFRNLMHLKCEMQIAPNRPIELGQKYRLVSQVEDIVPLRDDRVALLCASRVLDESGHRVRSYRDSFVILNLESDYVQALRTAKDYGHRETAEFQGLAGREPKLGDSDGIRRVMIEVPDGMGFRYGKVSGDLNLVHTTALAAKLFGHPRPFVQGLCTANYVLRHLTEIYGVPERFTVTFAKRVFIGQEIGLRLTRNEFEVCDSEGALLAFGHYDLPADRMS